jgi:hypothetical protein
VLWRLDRLGRDLRHLVGTAEGTDAPIEVKRRLGPGGWPWGHGRDSRRSRARRSA